MAAVVGHPIASGADAAPVSSLDRAEVVGGSQEDARSVV